MIILDGIWGAVRSFENHIWVMLARQRIKSGSAACRPDLLYCHHDLAILMLNLIFWLEWYLPVSLLHRYFFIFHFFSDWTTLGANHNSVFLISGMTSCLFEYMERNYLEIGCGRHVLPIIYLFKSCRFTCINSRFILYSSFATMLLSFGN